MGKDTSTDAARGEYSPLVTDAGGSHDDGPSVYNYEHRDRKDRPWAWAYWLGLLVFVVGGVTAAINMNLSEYNDATEDYLANPDNCPAGSSGRGLLHADSDSDDSEWSSSKFGKHAWPWLLLTLVVSLVAGIGYVKMFEAHAEGMMVFGAVVQVVLCVVLGLSLLGGGAQSTVSGIFLLICGLVAAAIHWSMRRHFDLCASLFRIATTGLKANPFIFVLVLFLWGMLVCGVLVTVLLADFALANGHVKRDPYVEVKGLDPAHCVDGTGLEAPCCVWQPKPLASAYVVYAILFSLWTFCILFELKVFSIAGTITQWYFGPPGMSTKGTLLRSLGHGLGASFGSIVLGGLVLTILKILHFIVRAATSVRRNIFLMCICMAIRWILLAILSWLEFLTRFATIWASVKGDSFIQSGRQSTEMLKRNFLDSTIVWWFPPWVVGGTNFVLSILWGTIMYFLAVSEVAPGLKSSAGVFGCVAGVVAYLVLSLTTSMLLNIVEVVYFCYAIDKDTRVVSNAEVHEAYAKLPKVGAVVEQPEGEMMYGAPQPQDRVADQAPRVATLV